MGITDTFSNYFGFDEHGTDLRTELLAGLTTFLTMSYIIVVNPSILADGDAIPGPDGIALAGYSYAEVVSMLAVVTILAAFVATLIMALYANRPFAQAPGLGLNAFFALTVVLALGVPWQTALAAVVVEGLLFIVLTAVGARKYIIEAFPAPVKFAVGSGIGAFLALIGLQAMNVVVAAPESTYVTLGPVASDPVAILSVIGLLFTLGLYARGVRGSIIIGILLTAAAGIGLEAAGIVGSGSLTVQNPPGAVYDITPLVGAFVTGFQTAQPFTFALVVFTFFFVDFFDTAGTLTGVGQAAGFLDEDGDLPEIEKPLMSDAIGTTVGGMIGTSTVTTYIESATGVEEGGRTGMTALVVAALFLVSLVFVPVAASIPQYASHIALVIIAVVMLQNITEVDWGKITHTVPAGLTILIMPFTYNIGYGIAAGIISYPIVKAAVGEWRDVSALQWILAGAFVVYFFVVTNVLA